MTIATKTAPSRLERIIERALTFWILACLTFIASGLLFLNLGFAKLDLSRLNLLSDPKFDPVQGVGMAIFVLVVHAVFVAPGYRHSAEESR